MGIYLNLGSGKHPTKSTKDKTWINIDIDKSVKPDVVLDLEEAILPYANAEVSGIFTSHTLEHINNFIPLMRECWRVLMPDGYLSIRVPAVSNKWHAFQDPTHVRFFTKNTFLYFDRKDALGKIYNWDMDFKITELKERDMADMKEIVCKMEAQKPPRNAQKLAK